MNEVGIQGERAYEGLVEEIITTLQEGRAQAIASVAEQRFLTYHAVGRAIIARQQEQGWGARVIKRLAADLRLQAIITALTAAPDGPAVGAGADGRRHLERPSP